MKEKKKGAARSSSTTLSTCFSLNCPRPYYQSSLSRHNGSSAWVCLQLETRRSLEIHISDLRCLARMTTSSPRIHAYFDDGRPFRSRFFFRVHRLRDSSHVSFLFLSSSFKLVFLFIPLSKVARKSVLLSRYGVLLLWYNVFIPEKKKLRSFRAERKARVFSKVGRCGGGRVSRCTDFLQRAVCVIIREHSQLRLQSPLLAASDFKVCVT